MQVNVKRVDVIQNPGGAVTSPLCCDACNGNLSPQLAVTLVTNEDAGVEYPKYSRWLTCRTSGCPRQIAGTRFQVPTVAVEV
jgi:hypothetical protein